MYHPRLVGSHYAMGFRYGNLMKRNNAHISQVDNLTDEKIKFGKRCIEVCNEVFPEAIEEMQGLAEGLEISFSRFAAWVLCIYCYEYARGCTCFAISDDSSIIFGRNSDFYIEIRDVCESALYMPDIGYSFIGNSTAMVQMEDGYNENGLAIGLTFIPPKIIKPGLNAGMLLRYVLEKCRSVKEALHALRSLPVSSAQTFIMIDKTGNMAVVECNCDKFIEIRPERNAKYLVSTNQFNSEEMKRYEILSFIDSRERYRVARQALMRSDSYSCELAQEILAGKHGFMCQYDRRLKFDTLWSTVYDLKNDMILRAEGNPARAAFKQDERLRAAQKSKRK